MSKIIPIFVPHFGCPRDCVFCNQNKISGSSFDFDYNQIRCDIEEYLNYFKEKSNIEIAFYGGSFTAIDLETQKSLLGIANDYLKSNIISEIRISTRPDCVDDEILKFLKRNNVSTIELGVQSLNEEVLKLSNRGHDSKSVYTAANLIKKYDFKLGLQQMIGLPGDNKEKSLFTAKEFVKLKPECVRIYPTLVISNTELERLYLNKKYKPLSLPEAVDISKDLLKIYYYNNINVIRVGLQPTENIQMGKDVVAGPFHPSFRQLCEELLVKESLDLFLKDKVNDIYNKELIIRASNKNINNIVGQKGINKEYFTDKYKLKKLKLYYDNISENIIKVSYDDKEKEVNIV